MLCLLRNFLGNILCINLEIAVISQLGRTLGQIINSNIKTTFCPSFHMHN